MTIQYVQAEGTRKFVELLTPLWVPYMREIYEGDEAAGNTPDEEIKGWLKGRVMIQGQRDTMHLELIYSDGALVGFTMYAIDLGGIQGVLKAGHGYIMEIYIIPAFRRKGIASQAYEHMENILKAQGAKAIYLTSDTAGGVPFWRAMGFTDSGKRDPDTNIPIYVKELPGGFELKSV